MMSDGKGRVYLGDERVAIFVPSRYADGQPIPPHRRDYEAHNVSAKLTDLFGGATTEPIDISGTFAHKVNDHTGVVAEAVLRVWVAVTKAQLSNRRLEDEVMLEACRLRDALRQESVLVEWGRRVFLTPSAKHPRADVTFGDLPETSQEQFALASWHGVRVVEDLLGVLSLAGWRSPTRADSRKPDRVAVAEAAATGGQARRAWHWRRRKPPSEATIRDLHPGDILVMPAPGDHLRFWLRTKSNWAGPRDIPLTTLDRPICRLAIEFVLAVLHGASRFSLEEILAPDGTTSRFFCDIRKVVERLAAEAPRRLAHQATGMAQRLIGRLLFVRFVEEKGWLPRKGLRDAWVEGYRPYYRAVLLPLFRALDTPKGSRAPDLERFQDAPYLNGGLFASRPEDHELDLPDTIFDPDGEAPTVLKLLYGYEFTLTQKAGRDELVSVDPAMLGRVLEGLTPDVEKKKKGIHYTPAPIAKALAVGGITPQLARRMRAAGHPEVDEASIRRLVGGEGNAIGPKEAHSLRNELTTLRIVDPAVGSGGLLLACLDALLDIDAACARILGGDLQHGGYLWAEKARQFVTECLYGVDISADAVDIARLRLWLYLAVGQNQATALPDLGYNLRVGDSLTYDVAERRLEAVLTEGEGGARKLEYDTVNASLNRALDSRKRFLKSSGADPSERAAAFEALEETERNLRLALGVRGGKPGEAPPFAWRVHFPEVFKRANRGFDLVIANPPYVRTTNMPAAARERLRKHYRTIYRNADLYYAFLERCFRAPSPVGASRDAPGLAGREGNVAFIVPGFSHTTSAKCLRDLLADGGHVEGWVDFVHNQVFPGADNFVVLLFATAKRGHRTTFPSKVVTPAVFAQMRAEQPWLEGLRSARVPYKADGWDVRGPVAGDGRPLVELATVEVGVQTSWDDFYLVSMAGRVDRAGNVIVRSKVDEVQIERDALLACAKGSKHLRNDEFVKGAYLLWPYDAKGQVLTEAALRARFPKAWRYLEKHRVTLEAREGGKLGQPCTRLCGRCKPSGECDGPCWWRFRRFQGVEVTRQPKVLVPSIMLEPTAYFDREGRITCTASGAGGGGAWAIRPRPGSGLSLEKLALYLRSERYAEWLSVNADPKKGDWWGVDRKTLERCPIPRSVFEG